jgi:hypothetical protein
MHSVNNANKQRRTFTLSPSSLSFLEQEARRRGADSQSAVLDTLLQEKNSERRLASLEASVRAYYDGLTDCEVEENKSWGEFASKNLALSEEEHAHADSAARRDLVHENADRPAGKRKASGRHRFNQRKKQPSAR